MKEALGVLVGIIIIIFLPFINDHPNKNLRQKNKPLQRMGGFSLIDIKDKKFASFKKYAEKETIKKYDLEGLKYETVLGFSQIVTGTNFSFFILVKMNDGTTKIYNTIINSSLKKILSLLKSIENPSNTCAFVNKNLTNELLEIAKQDYIKQKRGEEFLWANCVQFTEAHYPNTGLYIIDLYLTNNRIETASIYVDEDGQKIIQGIF